jgi:HD-GYP domain-containing protein (c-di-GMP phosphodiesterase class II)
MTGTIGKKLNSLQLNELAGFGVRVGKLGANFAICNIDGELVLMNGGDKFAGNAEMLIKLGLETLKQNSVHSGGEEEMPLYRFNEENLILAAVLKSDAQAMAAALIDLGKNCVTFKPDSEKVFAEMLTFLVESFQNITKAQQQTEMVCVELSETYEELMLLHRLSMSMKVTETDSSYLQMACDSLTEIVNVEGIAILVKKPVRQQVQLVLTAGSGVIDVNENMAAVLYSRLINEINSGKEALLDSRLDSSFKYDWPKYIRNIIAVPLYGKDQNQPHLINKIFDSDHMIGLMVAINRIDKPDFDSSDVKLFNSVANNCAVFIENGRLFSELKGLFIGSLKALTSSIDAKDQYTHGHSERVAFISRWIAERVAETQSLEQDQIHRIYLAGLLHDIGKIGVSESILCKKGRLTESEMNCMKTHPSIGAAILGEIKQMSEIVPGVLYHHERIDGRGYPEGLVADQIPLTGRILCLADSFDAMTSKRTYREAMTLQQALIEVDSGLGSQFDREIGKIFLDSDIYSLWDIMQNGFSAIYEINSLSQYGAVTVETLIR